MPRLAWLAFAGNPFCAALEEQALAQGSAALPDIDWSALQLHELLGEGASGVIHRATHLADGAAHDTAVKLFKGAMTSDGLPRSEMAACLRAGRHAHLIPLRGRVSDHPQGSDGLVMDLMDAAFQNLAGPPSLDSCTRDIYAPERRFDLATALRIAAGMASAARHLHRQGVLHGDLYAHNTLTTTHGQATLGDFGAACLYRSDDVALGEKLQRLEARAFGCLLEELLERVDAPAALQPLIADLKTLQARCLNDLPAERPLFAEIEVALLTAQSRLAA